MNDLSFADELTARLHEAAATADVTLPADLDTRPSVEERHTDVAPVRRFAAPSRPADRHSDTPRWAAVAAAALIVVGGGIAIALTRPDSGASLTSTTATTMPSSTIVSPTVPVSTAAGSTIPTVPVSTAAGSTIPTVPVSTAAGSTIPTVPVSTAAGSTIPAATVSTAASGGTSALSRTIVPGDQGDEVAALQRRLSELGFDPGSVDGVYGTATVSAVWAFKTLVDGQPLDQVTDEVTPELWAMINGDVTIEPRRAGAGNHIEIYLPQQVMVVFTDDTPGLIAHISSGELDANGQPVEFCEQIVRTVDSDGTPLNPPVPGELCGTAKTPGGVFEVGVEEEGKSEGLLSVMWDPVYFNHAIAIHGALNVPLLPASHGTVRVERHISPIVQSIVATGDKVYVWNGTQEPEDVSKADSLPTWDRFTPDGG